MGDAVGELAADGLDDALAVAAGLDAGVDALGLAEDFELLEQPATSALVTAAKAVATSAT